MGRQGCACRRASPACQQPAASTPLLRPLTRQSLFAMMQSRAERAAAFFPSCSNSARCIKARGSSRGKGKRGVADEVAGDDDSLDDGRAGCRVAFSAAEQFWFVSLDALRPPFLSLPTAHSGPGLTLQRLSGRRQTNPPAHQPTNCPCRAFFSPPCVCPFVCWIY